MIFLEWNPFCTYWNLEYLQNNPNLEQILLIINSIIFNNIHVQKQTNSGRIVQKSRHSSGTVTFLGSPKWIYRAQGMPPVPENRVSSSNCTGFFISSPSPENEEMWAQVICFIDGHFYNWSAAEALTFLKAGSCHDFIWKSYLMSLPVQSLSREP